MTLSGALTFFQAGCHHSTESVWTERAMQALLQRNSWSDSAMASTGSLAAVLRTPASPSLLLSPATSQLYRSQVAIPSLSTSSQPERRRLRCSRKQVRTVAMADSNTTSGSRVEEKLGVRIERSPSEARLQELGIRTWPKWGCQASKFPWTYDAKETCYLLQGKVKVYPEGSSDFVEFGAGDLVVFPKGMSCTWDVSEAVDKHYEFEY